MEEILRAISALLIVLAAILAMGWALRKYSEGQARAVGTPSDLRVLEWRGLDSRRKLAVVLWDNREHLLCLGPAGDQLIASRQANPPASPQETEPAERKVVP